MLYIISLTILVSISNMMTILANIIIFINSKSRLCRRLHCLQYNVLYVTNAMPLNFGKLKLKHAYIFHTHKIDIK